MIARTLGVVVSRLDAFEIFMVVGKDQTRTLEAPVRGTSHDTNTIDLPRKSQQGKNLGGEQYMDTYK